MCLGRWERQVLMCLTMHFTAKLLKSCAVYTSTFEYLSSGQFNYPGPSVISAALLSLCFCSRHERFVCGFIKIRRLQEAKHIFLLKYLSRSSCCTHAFTDTVHIRLPIKSFKVGGGGRGGARPVMPALWNLSGLLTEGRGTHAPNPRDSSRDIWLVYKHLQERAWHSNFVSWIPSCVHLQQHVEIKH